MNFFTSPSSEITNPVWKSLIQFPWNSLKNWKFLQVNYRIKYILCITATAVSLIHQLVSPLYWWYLCAAQNIPCTLRKGSRGRTEGSAWCSAVSDKAAQSHSLSALYNPQAALHQGAFPSRLGGQLPWLHITYLFHSIPCFIVFIMEWLRYQLHQVKSPNPCLDDLRGNSHGKYERDLHPLLVIPFINDLISALGE